MGQKTHPVGFRLGYIKDWQAHWFAEKDYAKNLIEDIRIRQQIQGKLAEAGIPLVEIERAANQLSITVHAARPGIVIGKGGQKVDELKLRLEELTGKKVRLNILEVRQPELNAYLVARNVGEQLTRRVSYKRAMKQAVARAMQRGALGIKVLCSGRLAGSEMSRREWERAGRVPLQTLRADIDYGFAEAHTTFGSIGVKVWVYRGEMLPKKRKAQSAESPALAEAPA